MNEPIKVVADVERRTKMTNDRNQQRSVQVDNRKKCLNSVPEAIVEVLAKEPNIVVVDDSERAVEPLKKKRLKKASVKSLGQLVIDKSVVDDDDFEDERSQKKVKFNPLVAVVAKDVKVTKNVRKGTKKPLKKLSFEKAFSTQCRPISLTELVKSFNVKQIADLESIGFGDLTKLNFVEKMSHDLVRWLVLNFNGSSRMLSLGNCGRFVVTPLDVCDVFQLPTNTGNCVVEVHGEKTELEKYIFEIYGLQSGSSIGSLKTVLEFKFPNGGEDFKRLFVLYALFSFLVPTANRIVSFRVGSCI